MRSLVAFESIVWVDPTLLLRATEVYETDRIDFAEAHLVACAESTGVGKVASFAAFAHGDVHGSGHTRDERDHGWLVALADHLEGAVAPLEAEVRGRL